MYNANAGERIRILRELNNYTREAFAEKADISSKFLYEIEVGKKGFSADTLCRIASALSVSCDYIMYGKNEESLYLDNVVGVLNKFDNKQMGRVLDIISTIYSLSNES